MVAIRQKNKAVQVQDIALTEGLVFFRYEQESLELKRA